MFIKSVGLLNAIFNPSPALLPDRKGENDFDAIDHGSVASRSKYARYDGYRMGKRVVGTDPRDSTTIWHYTLPQRLARKLARNFFHRNTMGAFAFGY